MQDEIHRRELEFEEDAAKSVQSLPESNPLLQNFGKKQGFFQEKRELMDMIDEKELGRSFFEPWMTG